MGTHCYPCTHTHDIPHTLVCTYIHTYTYTHNTTAQKAEEEAAKVYEDFVESFQADEDGGGEPGTKAFVRGGVVAPGSKSHEASGGCATFICVWACVCMYVCVRGASNAWPLEGLRCLQLQYSGCLPAAAANGGQRAPSAAEVSLVRVCCMHSMAADGTPLQAAVGLVWRTCNASSHAQAVWQGANTYIACVSCTCACARGV